MYAAPEQFASSNKAAAEALVGLATAQFAMFERLFSLNFKTTKSAYENAIDFARKALSTNNPQDLLSLNSAAAQPALEKALAYSREVYEIVAQSQAQMTTLFQAQTSDLNQGFASFLDQYSKTAPNGSGVAMAALKSMLAAYGSRNQVAKQTTELAQANLAAASKGTKEAGWKATA